MSRFFEALITHDLRTLIERAGPYFRQSTEHSKFLTYDVGTLREWYRDETPVFGQLPYSELDYFLDQGPDPRVDKMDAPFRLASHPLQESAYEAFVREKRIDAFDSENVRLERYDTRERRFVVRQCLYSDGVKSNYTMDWQGKLRSMMRQDYGSRLPPLDEPRLSNSLGLAVIIWHRLPHGDVLPYLPRRVAGLAVFPGGLFHCTASGNAEWITGASTFDQMFTGEICRELSEEVGLERADLEWIVPVALCREFLRGGKPQLFFAGLTHAGAEALANKRRSAIAHQRSAGRQEVSDEVLSVTSPQQLYLDLARYGTIESFANMCYAHRCIVSTG